MKRITLLLLTILILSYWYFSSTLSPQAGGINPETLPANGEPFCNAKPPAEFTKSQAAKALQNPLVPTDKKTALLFAELTDMFRGPATQDCETYKGLPKCSNQPGAKISCSCDPKWNYQECHFEEDNYNCKRACCKNMCGCVHKPPKDAKCE